MSCSQAGQDLFVLELFQDKPGTYLDIGCGDCVDTGASNTLYLSQKGWVGLGIDIESRYEWGWKHIRQMPMICTDVTTLDWNSVINQHPFIRDVDYLSFDIDDATIAGASYFPWQTIRAKVITIEHDRYRVGDHTRAFLRHILSKNGYTLVCEDVLVEPHRDGTFVEYEDWWLDPNYFSRDIINRFKCRAIDGRLIHQK